MTKLKPVITVLRTGLIRYQTGLKLQQLLSKQKTDDFSQFKNYLVLQEFHPVYTIGIRTKDYTEETENKLKKLGAEFFRTNRGGLITFHGPGQLTAYPIINLKQFKPSMRWYVSTLEEIVIKTCQILGIAGAKTTQDTGIWIDDRKICAIGIHGSRYVTTHGIGLNCCTDLSWFDHITPCGIEGKGVTSLTEVLNRNVSVEEASSAFLEAFSEICLCSFVENDSYETKKLLKTITHQ